MTPDRLLAVALPPLPEVRPGDDLGGLVVTAWRELIAREPELAPMAGDVLVVTQKVVSKAEGRIVDLASVEPRAEAVAFAERWARDPRQVEVVLRESVEVLRMERGVVISRTSHGFVCANAGVDASNVGRPDEVTLLPLDPDASARAIRDRIGADLGTAPGVVVSDSFGRPWRWGIVDVALGVAGFHPLDDQRGRPDAAGRTMHATIVAVADQVASTAELASGKTSGRPLVLVRGASLPPGHGSIVKDVVMDRASICSDDVMKVGLQVSSFSWPGGDAAIGPTLARIARQAEEVGFDSLWVMDHLFQIRSIGAREEPMLEGLTTLGWLAAHTSRIRLGLMVGGIHYRHPGMWLKAVTTLDVLSGGRAWFGIGAAWNEEESRGLGIPMPVLADRFELLEDTLRFVRDGWTGEHGTEASFEGHATHATRILNSPQALTRPRVPILVGGGGEQRTLRLVARYADACNVFGAPEQVAHKYAVLRRHCEAEGRDYGSIERTNLTWISLTADGRTGSMTPSALVDRLGGWAEAGSMHTIFSVRNVWDPAKLEMIGRDVLPAVRELGEPSPLDHPASG